MIAPGLADLWAAARVLAAVPAGARAALMARLLAEAEAADTWRRLYDCPHPRLGDGSLMAAALTRPATACGPDDPEALAALALVARAVRRHLHEGAVSAAEEGYLARE